MAGLRHPGRPEVPEVTVEVRFFAGAQAAAGVAEERLSLPGPLTLAELSQELVRRHGDSLARVLAASSFLVDEVVSAPERDLPTGARIDVLPPFAGG